MRNKHAPRTVPISWDWKSFIRLWCPHVRMWEKHRRLICFALYHSERLNNTLTAVQYSSDMEAQRKIYNDYAINNLGKSSLPSTHCLFLFAMFQRHAMSTRELVYQNFLWGASQNFLSKLLFQLERAFTWIFPGGKTVFAIILTAQQCTVILLSLLSNQLRECDR